MQCSTAPLQNYSFINQLAGAAADFAAGRSCQTNQLFFPAGNQAALEGFLHNTPLLLLLPPNPFVRRRAHDAPFPPHLLSRQQWAHCLEPRGFPKDRSHLQTQSSLCQPARNAEKPRKTREKAASVFSTQCFIGACRNLVVVC